MLVSPKQNSRRIGECIYCGNTQPPLTKENIIPKGLNGEWTLLDASCNACSIVTSKFEKDTLKSLWPFVRTGLNMKTRRLKDRPKTIPLVTEKNGNQNVFQVLPLEYPLYLPMPEFELPSILKNKLSPTNSQPTIQFIHISGPTFKGIGENQGLSFVGTRINFSPADFARTIAKIGYCAAVMTMGVSPLRNAPIRQVILGSDPCIGYLVGSWHGDPENITDGLHGIMVRMAGAVCHVNIRLFAQFSAHENHVVVGEVDQSQIDIDNWLQL
jgi:hypothetical protein